MKRSGCIALAIAAFAVSAGTPTRAFAQAVDAQAAAPVQILITLRQELPSAGLSLVESTGPIGGQPGRASGAPQPDTDLDRIARDHGIRRVRGWALRSIGSYCEVFEIPDDKNADEIIAALAREPRVEIAQYVNEFTTQISTYNDPYADLQTSVDTLAVNAAHQLATGQGVKIAVIDSQVDARHPDLRGRIHFARDLVERGSLGAPEVHGTAIAGIIASAANNTEGIVGIAPEAEIAALRACRSTTENGSPATCSSLSLAEALDVAISIDSRIINLSLSGPSDVLVARLLDNALDRGIVVITAGPDGSRSSSEFPSAHPGVITALRPGSEAGLAADRNAVTAPAHEVLTTTPEAGYAFFSGTSIAAAHVTGVVALLLERSPTLDVSTLVEILQTTSRATAAGQSINACHALSAIVADDVCRP